MTFGGRVRDARGSTAPLGTAVDREAAIHTVSFLSMDKTNAVPSAPRLDSKVDP